MVRSASTGDSRSITTPTPNPNNHWESQGGRPPSGESNGRSMAPSNGRESVARGSLRDSREAPPSERYAGTRHGRSDSEATGVASSTGYPETAQSGPPRRHDYDVQAMETTPGSPRAMARNPIPPPSVVVRSEFPTITRSRQQQTLTCLVTVEVADSKWKPDPEDLGIVSPTPQMRVEDAFAQRPPSPARSSQPRFYPYEAPEVLEEMTENLRNRVDNWHGLDFNRYVIVVLAPFLFEVTHKYIDSENFDFTGLYVLAKTRCHGRNSSAISLLRCLSVSKRRRTSHLRNSNNGMKTECLGKPRDVPSRAPSSSRSILMRSLKLV